jgi:hypothetical protein
VFDFLWLWKKAVSRVQNSTRVSGNAVCFSLLFLGMGTLLLLANVIILAWQIPTLGSQISNLDDEISDKERKIQIREYDLTMYRIADGQALDIRNTLAILL